MIQYPCPAKTPILTKEKVESLDHFEDFDTAKNCPLGVEKLGKKNMELYTAPTVYLSSHGNPRNTLFFQNLGSFYGQNTKPRLDDG